MSEATGMGPFGPTKEIGKVVVDGSMESIDCRLLDITNQLRDIVDAVDRVAAALEWRNNEIEKLK